MFVFFAATLYGQQSKTEYLTVRVKYGKTISGYKYEVYVDIGVSGSHSLSGKITNNKESVTIIENDYRYEFTCDIDLLNYLGENGWTVISTGEIDVLDEHYNTYLMQRNYTK